MNDLISRSWLLDVVENLIPWDTEKDRNRAIHHVRELAPSAEPQWIPCSERLPENSCQCIVTAKVKHVDDYPDYEVDTADFSDGIFTTANSWWGVESIIAWMPLPEPYKGAK